MFRVITFMFRVITFMFRIITLMFMVITLMLWLSLLFLGYYFVPNKRHIGPNLGYSRNGYDRLSQKGEILVQIWDILGMGMLGCPK